MTGSLPVEPPTTASRMDSRPGAARSAGAVGRGRGWAFVGLTALLVLAYHRVLIAYFQHALESNLYSYVLLIPFVSVYLAWLHPARGGADRRMAIAAAMFPLSIGTALLLTRSLLPAAGVELSVDDGYALLIGSLVCGIIGVAVFSFGPAGARQLAFPLGFLFFLAPMPTSMLNGLNTFLQHASAQTSHLLIEAGQVPVLRDGLFLQIPGITLEVAAECSGIRSTVVLFITSIVASRLFLQRPVHRWLIVAAVLPLAVARNGLRIFTIAMLCAHAGPEMIDSPIHHRGGPVFFAASLVPLFLLLMWFGRRERRAAASSANAPTGGTAS